MGPICTAEHLSPFLPGHPVSLGLAATRTIGASFAAAPFGSPGDAPDLLDVHPP